MSVRKLQQPAEILKAIGHPVRLKLLELLMHDDYAVGELAVAAKQAPDIVSQQLKYMHLNKILERRRKGRRVYYRITDEFTRQVMRQIQQLGRDDMTFQGGEAI